MQPNEKVFVVDDDEGVRVGLELLVGSAGMACESFDRALPLLESFNHAGPGCILSDVVMPGMTGLQLLKAARQRGIGLPIVLLTGHADVELAVGAFRAGAFDFLEKPFSDVLLLDMLQRAIEHSRSRFDAAVAREAAEEKLGALTAREREIIPHLLTGLKNKEIARVLSISHRTVERHRQNVLGKLGLRSIVELARLTGAG